MGFFFRQCYCCFFSFVLFFAVSLGAADQVPIDINSAPVGALAEALPGIGPAKASAIVGYREEHGPFQAVDALIDVKGIGPVILAKLKVLESEGLLFVSGHISSGAGSSSHSVIAIKPLTQTRLLEQLPVQKLSNNKVSPSKVSPSKVSGRLAQKRNLLQQNPKTQRQQAIAARNAVQAVVEEARRAALRAVLE